MCVYSMVMDSRSDDWMRRYYPGWVSPQPIPTVPAPFVPLPTPLEIEEFRRLLERAREYDKKNNEPDCELEEKKTALKKLADALGVSIEFVEATPTGK